MAMVVEPPPSRLRAFQTWYSFRSRSATSGTSMPWPPFVPSTVNRTSV
jgi:hypothetical protein